MICNLGVVGSNPTRGSRKEIVTQAMTQAWQSTERRLSKTGEYQSGQMGQTVNLLVYTFGGSNPSSPTINFLQCGSSSVDRASAFQAEGREFEPRLPLKYFRLCSSGVEHFLGKEQVAGSNPAIGSKTRSPGSAFCIIVADC